MHAKHSDLWKRARETQQDEGSKSIEVEEPAVKKQRTEKSAETPEKSS